MNKYLIRINSKRCIGCHSCEIHCKVNKGLGPGPILCEISREPLRMIKGFPKTISHFRSCHHCEDPLCVSICPTDAMKKRADGIVYIEEQKCIGCMSCAEICPWDSPQFNPDTKKAVKCDYCMDRIDKGLKPACVTLCTAHALQLVTLHPA